MWEALYKSEWHHPVALFSLNALFFLVWALRTKSWLERGGRVWDSRFLGKFAVVGMLDAWATADHVWGVGQWSGMAASLVPLLFVVLGDYRVWAWIDAHGVQASQGPSRGRQVWLLLFSLLTPALAQLAFELEKKLDEDLTGRHLFLSYELIFLVVLVVFVQRRGGWTVLRLRPVISLAATYYVLWALADVLILSDYSEAGFALRLIPNLLYYGAVLPVMAWAARGNRVGVKT